MQLPAGPADATLSSHPACRDSPAGGEGGRPGLLHGREVALARLARQWFGEVPAGLPPAPASVNRENVLPSSGFRSKELAEELKRPAPHPHPVGAQLPGDAELSRGSSDTLLSREPGRGLKDVDASLSSTPKCIELSNKSLPSTSKARLSSSSSSPGFAS